MVTPDLYRLTMSNWGSGVTVVTTHGRDGKPYGLTVSSFTSVSLNPVLVLVCLDNHFSAFRHFKDSNKFGVSILSDSQEDISRLFARKGSERPDELYFLGKTGVPLLRNSLATLECETVAMYPGGDHTIFLGQVEQTNIPEGEAGKNPLLYLRGKYQRLT